jgi:hypothetical protein
MICKVLQYYYSYRTNNTGCFTALLQSMIAADCQQ